MTKIKIPSCAIKCRKIRFYILRDIITALVVARKALLLELYSLATFKVTSKWPLRVTF